MWSRSNRETKTSSWKYKWWPFDPLLSQPGSTLDKSLKRQLFEAQRQPMPDTNIVLRFVLIWLLINCKMDMIWVFNTVALIILLCIFSLLVFWHQLISPHFEILAWKQEQIKSGWQFFLSECVRILESKRDVWQLEHHAPVGLCLWGGIFPRRRY